MELIVKPTEKCNFKCTFCSSTNLVDDKASLLDLDKIFQFLKRFPKTQTIIVNGGDPLMVTPDYYWKLIKYLDDHDLETSISFTTNLWDFYIRPDKWIELFRHPRMGIATSFHYGETRRISKDRVFKEEDFWNISNLFLEKIGYRPDFISVISDENEKDAIRNVELAKQMGVECKLNYAMASGDEKNPYLLSKIYKIYLDIIDKDLADWEFNTKQLKRRLYQGATACPQNRNCDSTIRCLQPEGDYYSCGAFGDDKEFPIDFEAEMNSDKIERPLSKNIEIASLKEECFSCPMFQICNGCKKTVKDLKKANLIENHCVGMKKLSSKIVSINEQYAH